MKSAVKNYPAIFALALLAFAATSCRKPAPPAATWAFESRAETNEIHATFFLTPTNLIPGTRIDCELALTTPAATHILPPQLQPSGLELLDFNVLPASLNAEGNEVRQFHWTFQAGEPGAMTNTSWPLFFTSGSSTGSLAIPLPALVIHSAFAPGTFTNALPPLEETNAF